MILKSEGNNENDVKTEVLKSSTDQQSKTSHKPDNDYLKEEDEGQATTTFNDYGVAVNSTHKKLETSSNHRENNKSERFMVSTK